MGHYELFRVKLGVYSGSCCPAPEEISREPLGTYASKEIAEEELEGILDEEDGYEFTEEDFKLVEGYGFSTIAFDYKIEKVL